MDGSVRKDDHSLTEAALRAAQADNARLRAQVSITLISELLDALQSVIIPAHGLKYKC
jgi:hypothetical protein